MCHFPHYSTASQSHWCWRLTTNELKCQCSTKAVNLWMNTRHFTHWIMHLWLCMNNKTPMHNSSRSHNSSNFLKHKECFVSDFSSRCHRGQQRCTVSSSRSTNRNFSGAAWADPGSRRLSWFWCNAERERNQRGREQRRTDPPAAGLLDELHPTHSNGELRGGSHSWTEADTEVRSEMNRWYFKMNNAGARK